jgi:hypothetical protein
MCRERGMIGDEAVRRKWRGVTVTVTAARWLTALRPRN